mmetsp:Transcript_46983/g.150984  ORF Transcript_46983/g.150984 Transcript_46983/m.150984 type:complete len:93 (-) Transcript_46983:222-500(-)
MPLTSPKRRDSLGKGENDGRKALPTAEKSVPSTGSKEMMRGVLKVLLRFNPLNSITTRDFLGSEWITILLLETSSSTLVMRCLLDQGTVSRL